MKNCGGINSYVHRSSVNLGAIGILNILLYLSLTKKIYQNDSSCKWTVIPCFNQWPKVDLSRTQNNKTVKHRIVENSFSLV